MKTVPFEGVNFYAQSVVKMTEAEFVKHEAHHGLTEAQLKQAYKLCKAVVKPAEALPKQS